MSKINRPSKRRGNLERYQKGQTAKDKFNNLYVLQGIGKDGSNVWLLVRVYQHDLERYRFNDNANDLRRAKRSLEKSLHLVRIQNLTGASLQRVLFTTISNSRKATEESEDNKNDN